MSKVSFLRRQHYTHTESRLEPLTLSTVIHSGQTHDTCAVPAIILQRKIQIKVKSFTLTVKLNAFSENLRFYVGYVFKMK